MTFIVVRAAEERFWEKVDRTDYCWFWTAGTNHVGYGQFHYRGRPHAAHRYSYELHVGPIPDGYTLDHLCRVHRCVNPDHLEPVTRAENSLRALVEAPVVRGQVTVRDTCKWGHEYTPENTYRRPSLPGARQCRECQRANNRERKRRKRVAA